MQRIEKKGVEMSKPRFFFFNFRMRVCMLSAGSRIHRPYAICVSLEAVTQRTIQTARPGPGVAFRKAKLRQKLGSK
jgi:hypothetical protein